MSFIEAIRVCLGKYTVFSGRASRPEYWWFYLFTFLAFVAAAIIDTSMLGYDPAEAGSLPKLGALTVILLFLPSLAVAVRRLHDGGRSGWWWLVGLVPVVGAIVLLVFLVLPGTDGDNRYGPKPAA